MEKDKYWFDLDRKGRILSNFSCVCARTFFWKFSEGENVVSFRLWRKLDGNSIGSSITTLLMCHCFCYICTLSLGAPFQLELRNLILKYSFSYEILLSGKKISLGDLTVAPPFLRFDVIELDYSVKHSVCGRNTRIYCGRTIEEKCDWTKSVLHLLRNSLKDAKFKLFCAIDQQHKSYFANHQTLLDHICGEILPICTACRCYEFFISFYSDKYSSATILSAIMQFEAIRCCTNIIFDFDQEMRLPVEDISSWLSRSVVLDGTSASRGQTPKERVLQIKILDYEIPNVAELFEHLKKVIHFFYLLFVMFNLGTAHFTSAVLWTFVS